MSERPSRVLALCRFLILTVAIAMPSSGGAKPLPSPGTDLAGFFRLEKSIPVPLQSALEAYEDGRFFAAVGSLDRLIAAREPAYALDDAFFLRALSLIGPGWDDLAVPSLLALLEAEPPGPYYVPALLELVEVHDRAGRWKAIADAWKRYVDRPMRSGRSRGERVADLLSEFGTLRPPIAGSTRREKSLLSKPEELAVILEGRHERASDRLLYRSGLALLRLGRHEESLRALRTIAIESPYYPYARYSIAQDLFALGETTDTTRTLVRLSRYPKITQEERALGSRSRWLHAAIRFQTGEVDEGIAIAQSLADDDPEAPAARLLITTALLDAGKPALALAYDEPAVPAIVEAEAKRALMIGAAYASLGDAVSAARVLQGAAERVREARAAGPAREDAVDRLRSVAERSARDRRERDHEERAHVARGLRILLAHDGPWNLGTLLRRVRAALGAGPYRVLARGTKPRAAKPASSEDLWRAYLASPRRATIELALDRLADLESKPGRPGVEAALRILNAYLLWLEQAPIEEKFRAQVARRVAIYVDHLRSRSALDAAALRFDAGPSEVAAFRRRLAKAAAALDESQPEIATLSAARDDVARLLRKWLDRQLGQLVHERDAELRGLEFDLEVALSGTLAGGEERAR